tara:strand:+ start:2217 stop:3020 length:804 start_codon:yes stop_codon:yes gene_type:complete
MSRATLVDLPPEEEKAEDLTNEVEETQLEEELPEAEQPQEQPALPEKYSGKSLEQVVQMHQEAEKLLGRQSSEVGELRKVVDDFITSQPQQTAPQQYVEPEEDIDYFTDPQAAVNRAIENHPQIKEAQEYSNQYRKQTSLATLKSKHPDMQDILKDEKFADWIKASTIRTQLFVEADQRFNSEAADELFSLWKERKTVAQQTAQVEKQARKQQLKAANTGSAQGNAGGTRRKIYRRADIIKLMRTDPERYQAISEEILTAYAEGRVK